MEYLALLIPYAGMILGGVIAYTAIMASHRQKIAMIEAGMNPVKEEAKAELKNKKYSRLRTALLFVFVPTGILLGQLLYDDLDMERSVASMVFAFLFGGIAMATAYFINRRYPDPTLPDLDDED
ncbi:hypothetical protein JYT72_01755 [Crocinitomix catalasitica]|nr:hypothetical protein [Crocinitomix catalasitica]